MDETLPEEQLQANVAPRSVTPDLPAQVLMKLSAYIEVKRQTEPERLATALRRLHELWVGEAWSLQLRAVALLLADLIDQGWEVVASGTALTLQPPGLRLVGETADKAKERLRRALQTGRDRQLRDPGVRKFLARMHRVVLRSPGRTSIANVIDSGPSLVAAIEACMSKASCGEMDSLRSVIDPVVEVFDEDTRCPDSGLRHIDIWRYFRHSWSLEYRSTPGRQMGILVRNGARPGRPVMGIAMLASPVVRMRVRDDWIGWNPEPFLDNLKSGKWNTQAALQALFGRLEKSITEIRWDDLVSPEELCRPTERTVLRLEQQSAGAALVRARQLEEAYSDALAANEEIKSQRDATRGKHGSFDWHSASQDPLFLRKRSETLGRLLEAKRTLQSIDWKLGGRGLLDALLQHPNGLRSIVTALMEVRKAGLSSQVADVSVCGAVAPYSQLLVGKLVALLVASREVQEAYRNKYSSQVSIISSQMAGRPVYRSAELKILTTTSLYGNGSSQYNRLRLRAADFPELAQDIRWTELAKTAGYGTVHLGATTARVLREVSESIHGARRINHRFGEGASPRLRQMREAVDALGIDAAAVLNHATPRIFYGCELHPGAAEELLGLASSTQSTGEASAVIARAWRRRWLENRVKSESVRAVVKQAEENSLQRFYEGFADADCSELDEDTQAH